MQGCEGYTKTPAMIADEAKGQKVSGILTKGAIALTAAAVFYLFLAARRR
jgi:hypothetical protein